MRKTLFSKTHCHRKAKLKTGKERSMVADERRVAVSFSGWLEVP
jgi:hypothetical protein